MISPEAARQRAAETLRGFPPHLAVDYITYATTGDTEYLDAVVLGVIQFYLAKPPSEPLVSLPGTTRLREDLGVDSLTMVDTLFLAEALFDVKLPDEALTRVHTIDELLILFRQQLMRGDSTPPARD